VTLAGGVPALTLATHYLTPVLLDWLGRELTLSAFTAAWTPNVAFVILSAAIVKLSAQQDSKAARA
jgi:hypothetical protein